MSNKKPLTMDDMAKLFKGKAGPLADKRSRVVNEIGDKLGDDLADRNKMATAYVPDVGMFVLGYTVDFFDNVIGQALRRLIEFNGYIVIIVASENTAKKEWNVQIQLPLIDLPD